MPEEPLLSKDLDDIEAALHEAPSYMLCFKAAARLLGEVRRLRKALVAIKRSNMNKIETAIDTILPSQPDPRHTVMVSVDVGNLVRAVEYCEHAIQKGYCMLCHKEFMSEMADD